jgi:hypothetical protein
LVVVCGAGSSTVEAGGGLPLLPGSEVEAAAFPFFPTDDTPPPSRIRRHHHRSGVPSPPTPPSSADPVVGDGGGRHHLLLAPDPVVWPGPLPATSLLTTSGGSGALSHRERRIRRGDLPSGGSRPMVADPRRRGLAGSGSGRRHGHDEGSGGWARRGVLDGLAIGLIVFYFFYFFNRGGQLVRLGK